MAISSQTTCCIFVLHNFIRTISNSCKTTTIIRARTTTRQPTPPTTRLASSVVRLPKLRQQKLPKRRLSLRRGYQPDGYEFVEKHGKSNTYFFEKNFLQGRQSKSARSEYIASQVLSFEKKLLRHHVTTVFSVGGFRSYSPWSCLELSTMEISLVKFE